MSKPQTGGSSPLWLLHTGASVSKSVMLNAILGCKPDAVPQIHVYSLKIWHAILGWFLQKHVEWGRATVAWDVRLRLRSKWPSMAANHCGCYSYMGIMYKSASPWGGCRKTAFPHPKPFPPQILPHCDPLGALLYGTEQGKVEQNKGEWERTVKSRGTFSMGCRIPRLLSFFPSKQLLPLLPPWNCSGILETY